METNCICGRPFLSKNHSAVCPICIAEAMTGKNIQDVTEEEYEEALDVFNKDYLKTVEIFRSLRR